MKNFLKDVQPAFVLNYDETGIMDDPGEKK